VLLSCIGALTPFCNETILLNYIFIFLSILSATFFLFFYAVVGSLDLIVHLTAVCPIVGYVDYIIDMRNEASFLRAIIGCYCEIGVYLVSNIASKASIQIKGVPAGDRVLIVISACILKVYLPFHSSAASTLIPS
jgi:hypothetical protein